MFTPQVNPSSILPALSGIPNYPSGYETVADKRLLLAGGSGLIDGNYEDFHQDRDFNPNFLKGPDGVDILGKDLPGFNGKGINQKYVSPESYQFGNTPHGVLHGPSGLIVTYPPSGVGIHPSFAGYTGSTGTGVFNFKKFISEFSNAKDTKDATGAAGIDDFTIFNDYIHYLPFGESATAGAGPSSPIPGVGGGDPREVRIPFVSDLVPTTSIWDRYSEPEEDEHDDTDPDYEGE